MKRCPKQESNPHTGLLGGISAMWTDRYCKVYQCGAADPYWGDKQKRPPVAMMLFSRLFDKQFGSSLAGMIWPRAAVSASALWHYSPELDAEEITERAAWLSVLLRNFSGVASCPPGCVCDELSACGEVYFKSPFARQLWGQRRKTSPMGHG